MTNRLEPSGKESLEKKLKSRQDLNPLFEKDEVKSKVKKCQEKLKTWQDLYPHPTSRCLTNFITCVTVERIAIVFPLFFTKYRKLYL